MAQYCRYCCNMHCGDANYCSVNKACYSDEQICHTNKCKDFQFNEIDALTGNIYKPRKPKQPKENDNQMLFDLGKGGANNGN